MFVQFERFVLFSSQGWKWHSPACYWVGEDLLTFDEARKSCEDNGAALVTITNRYIWHNLVIRGQCSVLLPLPFKQVLFTLERFEQAFANSLVFGRSGDSFWIGLRDQGSSGSFHWLSGDEVSYTNWNRDQPGKEPRLPDRLLTLRRVAETSVCISTALHGCITAGLGQLTEGEFSLEISCCRGLSICHTYNF